MEKLLFQESQRFRQPWLYAILIASDLLIVYLLIRYSVFEPEEFDLTATIILIVTLILMILLTVGFTVIKLLTEIRQNGIYYRFKPFQKKFREIRFDELEYVRVKKLGEKQGILTRVHEGSIVYLLIWHLPRRKGTKKSYRIVINSIDTDIYSLCNIGYVKSCPISIHH